MYNRSGERFTDQCVYESDCFGGGSVMVWAGISHDGRTQLKIVHGTLNAVNTETIFLIILQACRASQATCRTSQATCRASQTTYTASPQAKQPVEQAHRLNNLQSKPKNLQSKSNNLQSKPSNLQT